MAWRSPRRQDVAPPPVPRDATFASSPSPRALLLDVADVATEERPSLDPATSMRVITSGTRTSIDAAADEAVWSLGSWASPRCWSGSRRPRSDRRAKIRETFRPQDRHVPGGASRVCRHGAARRGRALPAVERRGRLKEDARTRPCTSTPHEAPREPAPRALNADARASSCTAASGVTDEHDAAPLLKHALLLSRLFGAKRELLARLLHAELEV